MADKYKKPYMVDFGDPERENSIIKVIGVGGGGGNAVNHMYREGIHVRLQKRAMMTSAECSMMALRWHLSLPAWVAAPVQEQLR